MKELRCPHCQKIFTVDESEYADLLNQVRNDAFAEELNRRVAEMTRTQQALQQAAVARKEQELQQQFAEKERKYREFMERRNAEVQALQLNAQGFETQKQMAVMQAQQQAQNQLLQLKEQAAQELQAKKDRIRDLEYQAQQKELEVRNSVNDLKERHKQELAMKDELIAQYKDFKLRQSTKMIGESLEQFCNNQYEKLVRPLLPCAQFGKDNDVVEGTKGDFVFRDIVDGVESVSIMFEMKNEADETDSRTKHKNSDFFAKLDSDRRKKKCEYAVLVSLLELENDLYSNGIYPVPEYEKMYVVRPQQFLTIIQLLLQAGRNTVQVKRELAEARNKEVDVTNFENKLQNFRDTIERHYGFASKKFEAAIADIDATIKKLEAVKAELTSSQNYLRMADQDAANLTIRKLTYQNPTMKAKFEEARSDE